MVNLETAEKALKTVYLGVVQDQLNIGANPLLAKIEQTTSDIWGKEIVKMVPYGMNGGVGAGTEDGALPKAGGNNYSQFRLPLKNLYGQIEISDKAILASEHSAGAFVNLLNAEMDGLLKASKFNLSRMLYGNGSGVLCAVKAGSDASHVVVDSVRNLMEGMIVDYIPSSTGVVDKSMSGARIVNIDRVNKVVGFDKFVFGSAAEADTLVMQNSSDNEITGLGAIFDTRLDIYGLPRSENYWLMPYLKEDIPSLTSTAIQEAIDYVDEVAGSSIDMIVTSYAMKRKYLEYLNTTRTNIDFMNLDGGYKALSYNGIPLVSDRFAEDNAMYLLNTSDFKLHQLCDWRWLEGDGGKVIKQKPGTPCYSATLVKYADLLCEKPIGQAKLTFA